MEQTYKYYAFISYQRKDEKWADWLRNKLEHYRLPSNLRQQDTSLPKEIRPIFRDVLELSGGLLAEEIASALQQSKFLVVLCSPNSAKSPWVDKEIQSFIDSGRERYIVPFIIDGVPFSGGPETECFPPALRSLSGAKEVLGININEMGRDAAAVKVVARMFGLKFDSLWQRYERERKRKRYLMIGGSFLTTLVILLTSYLVIRGLKQREWKMLENQSRYMAETAIQIMDKGDSTLARRLAATILPSDVNHPKDRPLVPNAEYALWYAWGNFKPYGSIFHKTADYIRTFDGHVDDYVPFVCFSPDGKTVLSCDYNIHVLDAKTGEQIRVLKGHSPWIRSIAFSPDGKKIASGADDRTIRIWNAETGKQIGVLNGHLGSIYSIAFSPNGKYIASGSDDNTIRIWDAATGEPKKTLAFFQEGAQERPKPSAVLSSPEYILAVTFSPDGKRIVSGCNDNTIHIWDVKTGEQIRAMKGGCFLTYSPDHKQIVSITDDAIRFWDANSFEQIKTLRLNVRDKYLALNWPTVASPNGDYFASANIFGRICIWDVMTGEPLKIYQNNATIVSIAFSPDGKQLVFNAAEDMKTARQVNIWDLSLESLLEKTRNTYPSFTPEERRQFFLE